jgi:acetyl-CoA carboxylase biotin carboxyl carrier protein
MESGESIMLKIQEIREIIKLIDQSSIEKFTYESDGAKLELKKGSGAQAAVATPVVEQVQPVQQEISAVQVQKTVEVIVPQQETPAVAVTQLEDPSLHQW